jgi:hypothetical protein
MNIHNLDKNRVTEIVGTLVTIALYGFIVYLCFLAAAQNSR